MSDNVQSIMLDILKQIQGDISSLKSDVSTLKTDVSTLKTDVSTLKSDMAHVRGRVDHLEVLVRRQRRDSAAMLVMMRGVVGVYDERLRDIEDDVAALKRGR
jgi:predicted  nucleic acid-binding Zn-ribbon protein